MSLSSWMPLSISRISVSRSLIWVSWNSSSCAGIWLLSGVAQAKGKGERCRSGEGDGEHNAPLDDLLLLQLLELVLLSRTDLPLLLEIEQSCRCSVRSVWMEESAYSEAQDQGEDCGWIEYGHLDLLSLDRCLSGWLVAFPLVDELSAVLCCRV